MLCNLHTSSNSNLRMQLTVQIKSVTHSVFSIRAVMRVAKPLALSMVATAPWRYSSKARMYDLIWASGKAFKRWRPLSSSSISDGHKPGRSSANQAQKSQCKNSSVFSCTRCMRNCWSYAQSSKSFWTTRVCLEPKEDLKLVISSSKIKSWMRC